MKSVEKEQLARILESMDVPDMRRDLEQAQNLAWLGRNLPIRNQANPALLEALGLIRRLQSS